MRVTFTLTFYFLLYFSSLSQVINSSFIAPDTVCVNQTFTIQNTTTGTVNSIYWNFCSATSVMTQTKNLGASAALAWPTFASINNDNGNYYVFVNNNNPSSIARYSYGNNLNNIPVITNLGNFGGNLPPQMEGLRIEKEGANWYGLGVGGQFGSAICRLNFGTSLANTPTLTNMGNIGGLAYPVRLQLIESGGNRYGFTVNHDNNTITRFSFGNSLANIPTGTNLGNIGGLSGPCDIAFAHVGNTWYAFVIGDGNTITRLNFGSSLLNTPTGTNLGNPGGLTNGRSIFLEMTCNGLKGQLGNGSGNNILDLNFPSGPTGPLVTTNLGNFSGFNYVHSIDKYRVGDTVFMYVPNTLSNSLSRIKYTNCISSSIPSSTLQNLPPLSYSVAGTYTIVLSNNGLDYNKSIYCKTIVATTVGAVSAIASPSNGICSGGNATLTASGATSYTWSNGSTTNPLIVSPTNSTSYTVTGATAGCSNTAIVIVTVSPGPTITVNSDTICQGGNTTLSASGAGSYTWTPGNFQGATITVTPSATTNYTVIGSNGSCTAAAVTTVVVTPGPTITANATPTVVCAGSSSTLTSSGALSYTWQPGNINGSSITVSPATSSIYTVSGTGVTGCVSSSTLLLTVVPNPTITINPNSPAVCLGNSATLTANGAVNYTWSPGSMTGATLVVTPTTTTSYTVNGDNGTCPDSATVTVTVNSNPTITPSASSTLVCSAASVTLSANGATTYTWNPGNMNGSTVIVSPTITTQYTVTGTAGLCTDTKTILITVNNGPTVTIVSSPTTICSASGASATLSASGGISYIWNPGGILASAIVITPTVTTTYSVISSDGMGCVSTTTVSYSVTPTPTINATATSTSICIGKSTTLTATGAGTYTWNPGSSNSNTINVSPLANTIYTISGTNGNCTSSSTISIIVNSNPTITASSSPTLICSGNSSTLNANGASTYTWLPGSLTGQSVTVSPGSTTNYSVTGMSVQGCTANAVVSVSVNPTPTLNVTSTPTAICPGSSATLSASGATNYTWSPGGNTTSSVVVSPTITSNYTLTGSSNNCTSTKTVSLLVNPTPTINAFSNPGAICTGNSATLTGSGGATYTWNPGSLTGSTTIVSPTINTTYTLTGASSFGCINSTTVTLTVNSNPTITATANPTFICSGSGSSATLTAGGASTFTWIPGNITGSSVVVNPTVTTTYTVNGTNLSGCTKSQTISITVLPSPTLFINASSPAICRSNSATLSVNGATSYTWMPGGITTSSIIVSPTVTTVYTVTGNSGNCSTTKTFTLVVLPRPNINITAIPPVICNGSVALLFALGANSYTWNPTGTTGNTLVVAPGLTSTYTVTGTNLAGCTNTAITTVTVNPNPTITTVSSATQVCSGTSVTITSNGAVTYVAFPGTQTGATIVVTPTVTTTYTVTGVNLFGCTDSKIVTISVLPNPTLTAQSSGTLLCDGGTFSLSAAGATNYTWMPMGISANSIVTTASSSVNSYTLVGETAGCISKTVIPVQVINCNNTIFGITKAAGTPTLVYNEFFNVSFSITAVNASSLNLTNIVLNEDLSTAFPAPALFTVISQPVITSQNSSLTINPLFDGVSQISLTSPLTSTLPAGKRDTIVFTIRIDPKQFFGPYKNSVIGFADFLNSFTVADSSNDGFAWDPDQDGDPTNNDIPSIINLPYSELFIPNGFSPDDDGKNDLFVIKGLNGRKIKLTIFNRWGNKVYEKSEYDNSWNAVVNTGGIVLGNNKVPASTYYYIIEFMDGDKEIRTGFVVVQY